MTVAKCLHVLVGRVSPRLCQGSNRSSHGLIGNRHETVDHFVDSHVTARFRLDGLQKLLECIFRGHGIERFVFLGTKALREAVLPQTTT